MKWKRSKRWRAGATQLARIQVTIVQDVTDDDDPADDVLELLLAMEHMWQLERGFWRLSRRGEE